MKRLGQAGAIFVPIAVPCSLYVMVVFEFKVIHGKDHSYKVTYGFGFKVSVGT